MKKLYFLNETEKERILKLHKVEQFGKRWLKEQANVDYLDSGGIDNPTEKVLIPPPGEWTSSAQGDFKRLLAEYQAGESNRWTWQTEVSQWCRENIYNQSLGPNKIPNSDLIRVVERVGRAMVQGAYSFTFGGRGVSDKTVTTFKNELLGLKNIPNFCHANAYKTRKHASGGENLMELFDEIRNNQIFVTEIIGSLKTLAENTKVYKGEPTDEEKKNEGLKKKFTCLTNISRATQNPDVLVVTDPQKQTTIIDTTDGRRTKITERIYFNLKTSVYTTDVEGNIRKTTGQFMCDDSGEKVLLTPGATGTGVVGGILDTHKCLTNWASEDPNDADTAIMEDDRRKQHPRFSAYPTGEIYFFKDGTFLTQRDEEEQKDTSGNFQCSKRGTTIIITNTGSYATTEQPLDGKQKSQVKKTSFTMPKMGYVTNDVKNQIPDILKSAGISGNELNQETLNKLYAYFKSMKDRA